MKNILFITMLLVAQGLTTGEQPVTIKHIPIQEVAETIDSLGLISQALVPIVTGYAQSEKWTIKSQEQLSYTDEDENYTCNAEAVLRKHINSFLAVNPQHNVRTPSKKYKLKKIPASEEREGYGAVAIYDNVTSKQVFQLNLKRKIAKLFEEDKMLFVEEGIGYYTTPRLRVLNFLKNKFISEILLEHPNKTSTEYDPSQKIEAFDTSPSEKIIFTLTARHHHTPDCFKKIHTFFHWKKDIFHEVTEK